MKHILKIFSTTKFSIHLLLLYIIVIASATVIEEIYDTPTAKLLIYNAKWFEFLMILFIILFTFNIIYNKLFTFKKVSQLLFHISFILLILGGGITRYFGYEANMHIQETESTDTIFTSEPYFQLKFNEEDIEYTSERPLYFSQLTQNNFHLNFDTHKGNFEIKYKKYIFEAFDLFHKKADQDVKTDYYRRNSRLESPDALIVDVLFNNRKSEIILFYDDTRYIQPFKQYKFDSLDIEMTYGPKPVKLPFELVLKEFKLSKYPGTDIPSASESKVVLIDKRNKYKQEHILAKNRVLDYDGYRFFQTSYDDDEKGTILSLNYDFWGTRITYLGYLLMTIGAIWILISKNSHFSQLDKKIKEVRLKRKSVMLFFILFFGVSSITNGQNNIQNPISKEHSDKFGHLLVQTYNGRITSVNSLATDIIHKLTGKDKFNFYGKGEMDAMHIFLDMNVDPEYWKNQKLIKVKEKAIRDIIEINGNYASFNDFLNENKIYKLEENAKSAFLKDPSKQTTFDREIIKITEKVNIFNMVINGYFLRVFPIENDENNKWINWRDSLAFQPITGKLAILNDDLKLAEFNYSNIMRSYLISTIYAKESNDYTTPNKLVRYISSIQNQLTPTYLLPSKRKVQFEVFYNKIRIFDRLKFAFLLIGIVLLILAIIENFRSKPSRKTTQFLQVFVSFFIVTFIIQTFGMGLRWYIGGHAPWSNGYEVILLVAWGGIIAGLYVIRYSKIVLASTAILASILLFIAGLSYYDPQLTNLNPVLKSYWLIIHVAIITIGYGFLALGFLIGIINMFFYLFKRNHNKDIFNLVVLELTLINEKLITIGMLFTAIGTFIGCIWANESWGTYWSWNAKQTWSLIIVLIYGVILHFRLISKMKSALTFNIGAIVSFGSVIMTFVGVNYYFTKGLHSYATDDPPIFPFWAWILLFLVFALIISAVAKEKRYKNNNLLK